MQISDRISFRVNPKKVSNSTRCELVEKQFDSIQDSRFEWISNILLSGKIGWFNSWSLQLGKINFCYVKAEVD